MPADAEALKRLVGEAAAELVENDMVVGLGTGSTANCLIDSLGERVRNGLRFIGIPTSKRSEERARALGITIEGFDRHDRIDLCIDGADEIARGSLHLVKGLGGALLREKIVAAASDRMVVVADESKLVDHLGTHAPVPVEISSFGWESTVRQLAQLGARPTPRRDRDGVLFVTDGGNMIVDCAFAPIEDPPTLEASIRAIVGVFECGLFISRAECALVAGPDGVVRIDRG
ncbi:ribose-5-phosphate isomerase RpiA [Acetobacteraceae bacterium KSS8]|uniref:Ribose-5-phosphate isomerase A n=1 Tax=Endosaccharibacter trunci TaxID=2812733 RepID=A0ABT1W403_9PROT|nr:ribose-5-phosphate isomerase RpiA [Acetobacteraceae bacterium KSS8]